MAAILGTPRGAGAILRRNRPRDGRVGSV